MPIHVNIHGAEPSGRVLMKIDLCISYACEIRFLQKEKKNGSISNLMAYRKASTAAAQYKECIFNLK